MVDLFEFASKPNNRIHLDNSIGRQTTTTTIHEVNNSFRHFMSTGIFSITIESRQIALDTINTKSTIDTSVVYNKMEATKKNNEMSNKNSQSILIKIFSMH